MKDKIDFAQFLDIESKLEIKVGYIVDAEKIPKKDKLVKLTVNFGQTIPIIKTVVTNLGEFKRLEEFKNIKCLFVTNLEPSKIGGVISHAMILGATKFVTGYIDIDTDTYQTGSTVL